MKTKKWYKSKTLMLNLIASTFASLGLLDKSVLVAIGITNTEAFLSIISFITTTGNIYLRLFIDQESQLTIKTKKDDSSN